MTMQAERPKPDISIVMTAWNRASLLDTTLHSIARQSHPSIEVICVEDGDDGETRGVCERHGIRYIRRPDRPDVLYSNQAIPLNMGIRESRGEYIILQNAECMHWGEVIRPLRDAASPDTAVFCACRAYNQGENPFNTDGGWIWYCHSEHRPRPLFFCGIVHRSVFERVGLFDEGFTGYGSEDQEFADRMSDAGIRFLWRDDIIVHHQWHPPSHTLDPEGVRRSAEYYKKVLDKRKRISVIS